MAVARHRYRLDINNACRSFFYLECILTKLFYYARNCSIITLARRIFSTINTHILVNGAITPMQRILHI